MISRSTCAVRAVRALPFMLILTAACNSTSEPAKARASVLLRNESPWPGTLQLTGGYVRDLAAASSQSSCVTIDTVPQDTALGSATILIPAAPRNRTSTWSFPTAPYLSVLLSGDSSGGVIVTRIGFSSDAAPCIP